MPVLRLWRVAEVMSHEELRRETVHRAAADASLSGETLHGISRVAAVCPCADLTRAAVGGEDDRVEVKTSEESA